MTCHDDEGGSSGGNLPQLGRSLSSNKKYDSFAKDEDDDFFDARGDMQTLQDMQAEI